MKLPKQFSDWIASAVLHIVILSSLLMFSSALPPVVEQMAIESFMRDEDRLVEDYTQELDQQDRAAETINVGPAGGVMAANVSESGGGGGGGGGGGVGGGGQIDEGSLGKDPDFVIGTGDISLPGMGSLGDEGGIAGDGGIAGETGAVVEGYGDALDLMTAEIVRQMRTDKILAVWLFDESESMKDDQEDLKKRIGRVYQELNLVQSEDAKNQKRGKDKDDVLLTSIVGFGKDVHYMLPANGKPTTDEQAIMQAIDRIPIDKTGLENTCTAIQDVIGHYRGMAGRRRMVLIVVSDESGDDGQYIEETLAAAKSARAPIYIMGRESVFGYPFAHVHWIDPSNQAGHYLPINRGPETPFAEQLQFDGFRRRYDSHLSGFGPYEQARMARDTGGVFFMLPHEEQDIVDIDNRKYEALDMKEYVPSLESRLEYSRGRDSSKFRAAVWQSIVLLNPYDPSRAELEVPMGWLSRDPNEYGPALVTWRDRILKTLAYMTQAQAALESVKPLREKEKSLRWRANYDLMLGQMMAYRLRLFQYLIALDQYGKGLPQRKFNDPKANQWYVSIGGAQLLAPDELEEKLFKIKLEDMQKALEDAQKQFKYVIDQHPRTPWAKRAQWEVSRGFGPTFNERFYIPPPPPKNPPPATPVPKL